MLNRYLAETRATSDLDALAALPLFMSVRAAIRAKVTAARLEAASDKRDALAKAARDLFRLRLQPDRSAAAAPHRGRRAVRHRQVGAGARARPDFPPAPGAVHLRSDVERKALFGAAETERLPAEAYSARGRRHESTHRSTTRRGASSRPAIRSIVDAVFARRRASARGSPRSPPRRRRFDGLFLVADLATRLARVGGRRNDASDADAKVVAQQQIL